MTTTPVTIKICKEDIHFNAAHFTIFSKTERERVHGHDYFIKVFVTCKVDPVTGICFDHVSLKNLLRRLTGSVDEYFLLPEQSSFLSIKKVNPNIEFYYQEQFFSLPLTDVKLLPIVNVSKESLSEWFLAELVQLWQPIPHDVIAIELELEHGRGQSVSSKWSAE
jgi:6-pyruvoyltetrahydropterin/6-carboxytetrahydropterin synthase